MSLFSFEPARSMVPVWSQKHASKNKHWEIWTRRAGQADWRLDSSYDSYDDALEACSESRKTFFNLSVQIVSLDDSVQLESVPRV